VTTRFVLYAPNVYTGGGFVLLRALLTAWPREAGALITFLDARAQGNLSIPKGSDVLWVKANVMSRLRAEWDLRRVPIKPDDVILCFHGLPPLLPNRGNIVVFQQNRNLLGLNLLSGFSLRTRVRLMCERAVSLLLRSRVSRYIVQTPTMQREIHKWYAGSGFSDSLPDVQVFPFIDDKFELATAGRSTVDWDFIYVADGEAHKNHRKLLEAWIILAQEGLRPSLALTLGPRDDVLRMEIESAVCTSDLKIVDLGQWPHCQLMALYPRAGALIFPSTSESFGLPLVEAMRSGLPIIASELDYVRDVCVPAQTFDPLSAVSISKAVKRYLGVHEELPSLNSASTFWASLIQASKK
jgi:glycosyltransferase involved in cell wall biosynthesis